MPMFLYKCTGCGKHWDVCHRAHKTLAILCKTCEQECRIVFSKDWPAEGAMHESRIAELKKRIGGR